MSNDLTNTLPGYTPDYIVDEIEKYMYKRKDGNSGIATYYNILALIKLAIINNRIDIKQGIELKNIIEKLKK